MPTEDFTSYTEVNNGGHITSVTASQISFTNFGRNSVGNTEFVYADKGAAHFTGVFTHDFEFDITASMSSVVAYLWGLSLTAETLHTAATNLNAFWYGSGPLFFLQEVQGGSVQGQTSGISVALSTTYYATLHRTTTGGAHGAGVATLSLYSDSARTTLVASQSIDLHTVESYRYVFGVSNYDDGALLYVDGHVANLDLNESGGLSAALGLITESDVAAAIGRVKARAIGPAVEADTAIAVGRRKARAIGPAVEVDAAAAIGRRKAHAIASAMESGQAHALGRLKSRSFGVTVGMDAIAPLGGRKSRALAPIVETAMTRAFGRLKIRALGVAVEIGRALGFDFSALVAPGTVTLGAKALNSVTLGARATTTITLTARPV